MSDNFVPTVLKRRVTFGEWRNIFVNDDFSHCEKTVYLNNHRMGVICTYPKLREDELTYHLNNDNGYHTHASSLQTLVPFVGWSDEATEF